MRYLLRLLQSPQYLRADGMHRQGRKQIEVLLFASEKNGTFGSIFSNEAPTRAVRPKTISTPRRRGKIRLRFCAFDRISEGLNRALQALRVAYLEIEKIQPPRVA